MSKIAHGGKCPNGYIFDHNPKHDTYGQCIPLTGKLAKNQTGQKPKVAPENRVRKMYGFK